MNQSTIRPPAPVYIRRPADLMKLAQEMKRRAMELPVLETPKYDTDKMEFVDRVKKEAEAYHDAGLNRLIIFATPKMELSISLALSFDKYTTPHEWHLSMVMPGDQPMAFRAVPEPFANGIALYVAGAGFREVPCEGQIIKEVRHFRRVAQ